MGWRRCRWNLSRAGAGSASNAAVEERPFHLLSMIRGRADREREATPRQAPLGAQEGGQAHGPLHVEEQWAPRRRASPRALGAEADAAGLGWGL